MLAWLVLVLDPDPDLLGDRSRGLSLDDGPLRSAVGVLVLLDVGRAPSDDRPLGRSVTVLNGSRLAGLHNWALGSPVPVLHLIGVGLDRTLRRAIAIYVSSTGSRGVSVGGQWRPLRCCAVTRLAATWLTAERRPVRVLVARSTVSGGVGRTLRAIVVAGSASSSSAATFVSFTSEKAAKSSAAATLISLASKQSREESSTFAAIIASSSIVAGFVVVVVVARGAATSIASSTPTIASAATFK